MSSLQDSPVKNGGTVSMCSLHAGGRLFGLDTGEIREVLGGITPQPVALAPEYIAGIVPYRGDILTAVSFRVLLGLEKNSGPGCVIVLDEEVPGERFGLMVDSVAGVVTVSRDSLNANPSTLDVRSMALFDGAYRLQSGLMVRLDPRRLKPSCLAECSPFGAGGKGPKGKRI
jgi:purine-binding chemotaxis protein CheW